MSSSARLGGARLLAMIAAAACGWQVVLGQESDDGPTKNRFWLEASRLSEFTDIGKQRDRTLQSWIERTGAKTDLPDKRGDYIYYRHASREDASEIVYWFGPFESGRALAEGLERVRHVTDVLRRQDADEYALARAVRIHAPQDDSIRLLTEENPEALELAWVLEQNDLLESVVIAEQELAERRRLLDDAGMNEDQVREILVDAESWSRVLREARLEQAGASDEEVARALFPGEAVVSGHAAELARERIAIQASAHMGSLEPGLLEFGFLRVGELAQLSEGLAKAFKRLGLADGAADDALASLHELTRAAMTSEVSVVEVRYALRSVGQRLLDAAGGNHGDRSPIRTRSLPLDQLTSSASSLARLLQAPAIQSAADAIAANDGVVRPAAASGVEAYRPLALSLAPLRPLDVQAASAPVGHLGGPDTRSAPLLREMLQLRPSTGGADGGDRAPITSSIALSVLESAFGPQADLIARAVGLDSATDAPLTAQQEQRLDSAATLSPAPIGAVVAAAPFAAARGVDLSRAMRTGLNAAAAQQFDSAMTESVADTIATGMADRLHRTRTSIATDGLSAAEADSARNWLREVTGEVAGMTGTALDEVSEALGPQGTSIDGTAVQSAVARVSAAIAGSRGGGGENGGRSSSASSSSSRAAGATGATSGSDQSSGRPAGAGRSASEIQGMLSALDATIRAVLRQSGASSGAQEAASALNGLPAVYSEPGSGGGGDQIELRRLR